MEVFFTKGSEVALGAAVLFLLTSVVAAIKICRAEAKRIYLLAAVMFAVSMLLLALLLFEWRFAFGRAEQATPSTAPLATLNTGLGQWGQVLGAGVGGSVLTLVGGQVISWWFRPKIKIEFENNMRPFCVQDPPGQGQIYWMRIKVTNSGRSTAKNCLGRIVQFLDYRKDPIVDHDPVQLHWVGTPWVRRPEELTLLKLERMDLQNGRYEFLDMLVTRPGFHRALLFVSADDLFGSNPAMVPVGTSCIQVTVYGENVKPCTKEYKIDWSDTSNYAAIKLK